MFLSDWDKPGFDLENHHWMWNLHAIHHHLPRCFICLDVMTESG